MADDCVFCKIADGRIPAHRVWENDACLAFLDIAPLARGHTLLISKKHFRDIRDVSPDGLAELTRELPRLAGAIMRATGAPGLNVLQNTGESAGQAVFHLHFHLIPRTQGDGLGFRWGSRSYREGEAQEALEALHAALAGS